jgi:hypothetical protein
MRTLSLWMLFATLLLSCSPAAAASPDADNDGYSAEHDCDDADPTSHPGIDQELCDGVDNNCDGEIDEYELDADGDGYALCDGDCDDRAPTPQDPVGGAERYPEREEIPNQIDDNCNGLIDEQTIYDDKDGDGYPEQIPGLPGEEDIVVDCDDTDPGINPGAHDSDREPDGVNSDCDGFTDEGYADHDLDGDGFTPFAGDCADDNVYIYPGAEEQPVGVDMNCDGELTIVYGHDCSTSPRLPDLAAVLIVLALLRRRRALGLGLGLGLLIAPVDGWAQDLSGDQLKRPTVDDLCAPMVAPAGAIVPVGEHSAQARARFLGGIEAAFREQDTMLNEVSGVLDRAWRHHQALNAVEVEIAIVEEQLGQLVQREMSPRPPLGGEPDEVTKRETAQGKLEQSVEIQPTHDAENERLQALRQRVDDSYDVLIEQMAVFGSFWGDGPGAAMWAEARAAVARGDLTLAESMVNEWSGDWPLTASPDNIRALFDSINTLKDEIVMLESMTCRCGLDQAGQFMAAASNDRASVVVPADLPPVLPKDGAPNEALTELTSRLNTLTQQRQALGASPLPVAGAVELRSTFDQLLRDFLSAPFRLDAARWTELWWRHGVAAMLAGDMEASRRSLTQAMAVAGEPLAYDELPPSVAYALQREAALVSSALRGTLILSVHPEATVLVNGRVYPLSFGEAELTLPPGFHLVAIIAPEAQRTYVAVHEVRAGREATIRWGVAAYPARTAAHGLQALPDPAGLRSWTTPSVSKSQPWRLQLGVRGVSTLYANGVGAAAGLTHTTGQRQLWLDGAGLALTAPVLRTTADEERALVVLSAGIGYTRSRGSAAWGAGVGAFSHIGFAAGPMARGTLGRTKGAWGVELDARLGWDVAPHESSVQRGVISAGVSMTYRPHRWPGYSGARRD